MLLDESQQQRGGLELVSLTVAGIFKACGRVFTTLGLDKYTHGQIECLSVHLSYLKFLSSHIL